MPISVSEVIGKQLLVDRALGHGRSVQYASIPEIDRDSDHLYFVLSRKDVEPERAEKTRILWIRIQNHRHHAHTINFVYTYTHALLNLVLPM